MAKLGRPKTVLTAKEQKIIGGIPACKQVETLCGKLTLTRVNQRETRLKLGHALVEVHDRVSKTGCKGLFTRWLIVRGLSKQSAYYCMANAAPKRFKNRLQSKCYQDRYALVHLLDAVKSAGNKVIALRELVDALVEHYDIACTADIEAA